MDSMAALALATEKAHPSLLDKKPYDQNEPLMNTYCVRRLVTMAVLQLATLLTILYAGEPLFETEKEPGSTETTQFSREHYTVIFNGWCFPFNMLSKTHFLAVQPLNIPCRFLSRTQSLYGRSCSTSSTAARLCRSSTCSATSASTCFSSTFGSSRPLCKCS